MIVFMCCLVNFPGFGFSVQLEVPYLQHCVSLKTMDTSGCIVPFQKIQRKCKISFFVCIVAVYRKKA